MLLPAALLPSIDAGRAYDEFAAQYDQLLTENRINAFMRRETTRTLFATFTRGSRLIELGCGTGDEAISLALRGCEVIACDPSRKMIEIAEAKAVEQGVGRNIRFFVSRAADLRASRQQLAKAGPLDGGYASFSLSYEPDLAPVSEVLSSLIRPSGRFVIASMNRLCGTELALALLAGRPGLAGRRLRRETLHKVGQFATAVFPRTPDETIRAFRPHFVLEHLRALPAILPPHYANRTLAKWPGMLDFLAWADSYIASYPLVRRLGDHSLFRFRRTESDACNALDKSRNASRIR